MIVKIRREETIVAADRASDSGHTAVRFENPADILLFGDLHDFPSRAFSLGVHAEAAPRL